MAEQAFELALAEWYALEQIGQARTAPVGGDLRQQLLHRVATCLGFFQATEQLALDHGLLRAAVQLGQLINKMRESKPGPVGVVESGQFVETDAEHRSSHAGMETHAHHADLAGQLQACTGQLRPGDQRSRPARGAIEVQWVAKLKMTPLPPSGCSICSS